MMLVIETLLDGTQAGVLRAAAADMDFQDGRATAGRFAAQVKANHQASEGAELEAVRAQVGKALAANGLFQTAVRPRALTPLILSRYRRGETYGLHVDDALMRGVRTDVSFTLFLSDPDTYEGGELMIEDTMETRAIKLNAGDLFLYPSTSLHRVTPVTAGERLAIVGWATSWIRDAGQREILFDLERTLQHLHDREGKSEAFDLLAKSRSNLLRLWADA
jgi:PKHD-type hydroxylase